MYVAVFKIKDEGVTKVGNEVDAQDENARDSIYRKSEMRGHSTGRD